MTVNVRNAKETISKEHFARVLKYYFKPSWFSFRGFCYNQWGRHFRQEQRELFNEAYDNFLITGKVVIKGQELRKRG